MLLSVYKMHQMNIHYHISKAPFFSRTVKVHKGCFFFKHRVICFQLLKCYYHFVCFGSDVCSGCFWTDVYQLIWQNSEELSTELLAFVHLYVIAPPRAAP